ncbi:MAG: TetR family transcriptional regulator [Gammaproteobacteria bacterium]|nr:TetR family transcriptional regulator [Gammaproteobacteria bacterium]
MRIRKSADERKAEVVAAALKLADEIGPDRVTTDTLAGAVGLTQPGLFRHFPKKQDIWESVAGHIGQQMQKRWAAIERRRDDAPEERLRRLIVGQLRLIQTFPAIPSLLFSRELLVENVRLRKIFGKLLEQFHQRLTQCVIDAQQSGHFRADLVPGDVAYLLIALVQGLAVRWSVNERRFSIVKEGERLLALQLQGFRQP